MANVGLSGTDLTTGQQRPVGSSDTITDSAGNNLSVSGLPAGIMFPFAGTVASVPTGYLPCDGTAVSRTTYSALFTAIGTNWGIGDGSTTFNLPDSRGKSIIGLNDSTLPAGEDGGFTERLLAATGGAETHTLAESEIPSHQHNVEIGKVNTIMPVDGGVIQMRDNGTQTASSTSTGGGGSHNNMQPFLACPVIIKT